MPKFEPSGYGKFRRLHKGHSGIITGFASEIGRKLISGTYGLKVLEPVRISPSQLEAMRKVLTKALGRHVIINFRVFAHKPVTAKPIAVRMGGGKGDPEGFWAFVQAGHVLFELDSALPDKTIVEAIESASKKIGCQKRIIKMGEFK